MLVLGLSAFYHDSAAALIEKGVIVAAAQEERFSRRKHDAAFPLAATRYCLAAGGGRRPDYVAFYEKPFLKFERLLESQLAVAPRGFAQFRRALPLWLKEKLFQKRLLLRSLDEAGVTLAGDRLLFAEHHQSHAASAFYPSPFEAAAVLTADGVGEWATTSIGEGAGARLALSHEIAYPHSLGLLYSSFTHYLGFKVNAGEYKVMGLAPYGTPRFAQLILDRLLDLKADGSFRLDPAYLGYLTGLSMTNRRFEALFGGPPRRPEAPLDSRHLDLAASIQAVCEEAMLRLARHALAVTGRRDLCLAGGVALNCVANGRILRQTPLRDLWVQPAAGDAGGALGAALAAYHGLLEGPRPARRGDAMRAALLGPDYGRAAVLAALDALGADYELPADEAALLAATVEALAAGRTVGWFQGRAEFGPRALGNRSILADPRGGDMQRRLNLQIKFRESFRPFAPAVPAERAAEWFDLDRPSPYMALVAQVAARHRRPVPAPAATGLAGRLAAVGSAIPAVTHVDGSARVQTVSAAEHPRFHALLTAFGRRTGCPVLLNTSFNVRGEPIVLTPADAYRCFMGTGLELLVIGDCLLRKERQPAPVGPAHAAAFEPD